MGSVYARRNVLWLKFKNERGEWRAKPSGFPVGQEQKAKALLGKIERMVEAGVHYGSPADGPLTVARWAEQFLAGKRDAGLFSL